MDQKARLTGILAEKDANSVFSACNDVFLKYAGVNNDNKVIGLTDHDMPWCDYAPVYRMHELDALSGKHYSAIIPAIDYSQSELFFLHTKLQRHDDKGNIVGIRIHAIEIINPQVIKMTKLLTQYSPATTKRYCLNLPPANDFKLTPLQHEILFFLLRGKTTLEIALILQVPSRQIAQQIDLLQYQFHCHTVSELIDQASTLGFHEVIPITLKIDKINESLIK